MSVLIKGGRVVTAVDDTVADVFVDGERISLIGESLDRRRRPGDRRRRQARPPGGDRPAHPPRHAVRRHDDDRRLHLRPRRGGARRHDDARRLLHPAAGDELRRLAGPVARQARGQGADRQRLPHRGHRPEGGRHARGARLAARAGDHLVQALHGLQGRADGRRRDALQDDGGRRRDRCARDGARRERRRDRRAREEGARGGEHGSGLARADAAAGDRGRGHEPGDPARARRRLSALRRPCLLQGVGRPDHARARARLGRLGRDVHPVLLRRRDLPRATRLRGGEVRLHAASAGEGEPGGALERRPHGRALGDLDRPLRLPLGRAEDARSRRLLEDPERRAWARGPACG